MTRNHLRIAYFITPHGFGHATRACAVMLELRSLLPRVTFDLFTTVPRWLFAESVGESFCYHRLNADIGLRQRTPLEIDFDATIRCLHNFLPFCPALVARLANQVRNLGCRLIICDIAPLGIAVARHAGVPAILIENFTWDWVYQAYQESRPEFRPHISYLRGVVVQSALHIQTEPVCQPKARAIRVAPISRRPTASRSTTRQRLGLLPREKVVVVTMGGIPQHHRFLRRLKNIGGVRFVIPGGTRRIQQGNLLVLPFHTPIPHQDIVWAADAVVAKLGYSTVAEAYHAGIPMGYVPRHDFRESERLAKFARQRMRGIELPFGAFTTGDWVNCVEQLLALPRLRGSRCNGATEAARIVADCLN